jgi:DNA polymerase-4
VVPPDQVADFLAPLAARRIPGIGPKAEQRLAEQGIVPITDLRAASAAALEACFGRHAEHYRMLAWGQDSRPVIASRERKSVGIEDTFATDIETQEAAIAVLERLSDGLCQRLAKRDLRGRTVTLKVKYHDFKQITRSASLSNPTADRDEIHQLALALLNDTDIGHKPVRLLGLALSHLDESGAVQQRLDLGDSEASSA